MRRFLVILVFCLYLSVPGIGVILSRDTQVKDSNKIRIPVLCINTVTGK
ncbi:MAG: hypothetical protein GY950_00530, partial [bacterium]|nr:hypothetical protein [bacterium]